MKRERKEKKPNQTKFEPGGGGAAFQLDHELFWVFKFIF